MTLMYTEDTQEYCQRAALVGLGGIGKTQFALQFAFELQKRSPGLSVFWVQASSITSFENSYRAIAGELGISGLGEKSDVKALVCTALSKIVPESGS